MRLATLVAATVIVLAGAGCGMFESPTAPSRSEEKPLDILPSHFPNAGQAPMPAKFKKRLVICDSSETSGLIGSQNPCRVIAEPAVPRSDGLDVVVGVLFQLQLYAHHTGRPNNCRLFGNVQSERALTGDSLEKIVTFNDVERNSLGIPSPTPLYLGGLRFRPVAPGEFKIFIQATAGCDVPLGTVAPRETVVVRVSGIVKHGERFSPRAKATVQYPPWPFAF